MAPENVTTKVTFASDFIALQRKERDERRRTRCLCKACGHHWRPRNPNTGRRCPECGLRGHVERHVYSDKPQEEASATTPEAAAESTAGAEAQTSPEASAAVDESPQMKVAREYEELRQQYDKNPW